MATTAEKRALTFLAALAALGITVRAFRASPGNRHGDSAALDRQIAAVDSATARRNDRSPTRGKARPRRANSDSGESSAWRSDSPRGPSREVRGRVNPDSDPADPLALYEARRRAVATANADARARVAERTAAREALERIPEPAAEKPVPATSLAAAPVDLDTADEVAIATIPGIGPSLARRIVADRARRGAFGSLQALQRVAGVGPGLSSRIALHVTFSRPAMGPPSVIRLRKARR